LEPTDPHLKKTITVRISGHELKLEVAHDLFSGHDLDRGSRLLLRSLTSPDHQDLRRVVDLGCGYGPLGLALKKLNPARVVDMVDRDALALTYARRNAELNQMAGVDVYASLGWSGVRGRDYDLAVSNVPAKAGDRAIRHFLLGARDHLRPGGMAVVVVIARIDGLVRDTLIGEEGVEVLHRSEGTSHVVYHYRFQAASSPAEPAGRASGDELDVYERGTPEIAVDGVRYRLHTAYSLPEFDTLGYQTKLLAQRLLTRPRGIRQVLVFNPGQGHAPVLAWRLFGPDRITLVDRDLLALSYSMQNMIRNGCPPDRLQVLHQTAVRPEDVEGSQLAICVLRDGQPAVLTEAELQGVVAGLRPRGRLVAAGRSTSVTRLETRLIRDGGSFRMVARKRNKGFSVLDLQR
jgi:16S rRNA (guanine1207-N2)-methyltransferase